MNCRACGAPIEWAVTAKNRRMPMDPDPSPNGNVRLSPSKVRPGEQIATVLAGDALATARIEGEDLRISHFATCPKRGRR